MKFLSLCFLSLLFINDSYAVCDYGFDRPANRQFVNMVERHFTSYEMFIQKEVQQITSGFVREKTGRKEALQELMNTGYLAVENSPRQNRLLRDILGRPSEEVIQTIRENPESLHEGTLLNLPPFFLVVFMGDRQIMEASLKIDRSLVNAKNSLEEVPLHYTLDPDMARGLFLYRAKPNEPDKKGRVPLYNTRNPKTVQVMLYYNANPMVKDRSGLPLIRYHREQVGDKAIVDLLEEARISRRAIHSRKPMAVPKIGEREVRVEPKRPFKEEKEARRRSEREKAERKRRAREKRRTERLEIKEAERREREERKSGMMSELADVMASTIMAKAMVRIMFRQTVDISVFSNVASTLQNVQSRSSRIVVYNKVLEERFEQELSEVINSVKFAGKSREEYDKEIIDAVESKTQVLENELFARLKEETDSFSIGKINNLLKKTEKHYENLEKMMNKVVSIRMAQNLFLQGVVKEIEVHPGSAAIIRIDRGAVIQPAVLFR